MTYARIQSPPKENETANNFFVAVIVVAARTDILFQNREQNIQIFHCFFLGFLHTFNGMARIVKQCRRVVFVDSFNNIKMKYVLQFDIEKKKKRQEKIDSNAEKKNRKQKS